MISFIHVCVGISVTESRIDSERQIDFELLKTYFIDKSYMLPTIDLYQIQVTATGDKFTQTIMPNLGPVIYQTPSNIKYTYINM